MTERRIAFRFVDWLTGDLIMVYERPADAVKRGFNEPFASYGGYSSASLPPRRGNYLKTSGFDSSERRLKGGSAPNGRSANGCSAMAPKSRQVLVRVR
jgi:hypothetical protein